MCLTLGKGFVGSALPLALAFAVDGEEAADLFSQIPVGVDRDVYGEVRGGVRGWYLQDHFATAVEFSDQGFSVEKPRIG